MRSLLALGQSRQDRGPGATRWTCGLVVVLTAVLLAGCQARVQKPSQPAQPPAAVAKPKPPPVKTVEPPPPDDFALAQEGLGPNEVRVGVLLPLSGRHQAVGQAMLKAAQLALFDGATEDFSLVVRDTQGTPRGAQLAASEALGEGVSLILGPLFAASVTAVTPEARARGVPVVAFSNDRLVAGDGIYVMGLSPRAQVERVVSYASGQGIARFGMLAPNTPYGNAVIEAMQQAVGRNGAQLSRMVTFTPGAEDLSPQVKSLGQYDQRRAALQAQRNQLKGRSDEASRRALNRLKTFDTLGNPNFEAVMLPSGGKELLALAPLLAFYDIDPGEVRYLGTALWNDPRLGTEPALVGGWFAGPSPRLWDGFKARYAQAYRSSPPRIATLAYDATALAAALARQPASAGRYSRETLSQPSGFGGVDGIFRFLPSGEVERGLAVLELQRNEIRVIDPAPQSFEQLIN